MLATYLSAQESGVLSNGLEYHLLPNETPKEKASIWLVLKAGMIHEDVNEKGFAHLVEHLVWRGTKNLNNQQINDELAFLGIKEKTPHIKVYTRMDATFFKLNIASQQHKALERAVYLLKEIASTALLLPGALDDEKNEVLQELREEMGKPSLRKLEAQLAVLLQHPVNLLTQAVLESIQKATSEELQEFYHSKYRPDRMALIAVGDFDESAIKKSIEVYFGSMKNPPQTIHEYKSTSIEARTSLLFHENEGFALPQVSIAYLLPIELGNIVQQTPISSFEDYLQPLVEEGVVLSSWSQLTVVSKSHQLLEAGVVLFDTTSILDAFERFLQVIHQIEQSSCTSNDYKPYGNKSRASAYAERFLAHSSTNWVASNDGHLHLEKILKECPKVITLAYSLE